VDKTVDVLQKEAALSLYNKGWRAYFHSGCGGQVYFKDGVFKNIVLNTRNSVRVWEALRAYQDEQRKKGEPINYDFQEINENWYGRTHIADGIKYHYCGSSAGDKITPEIVLLAGASMGDFPITGGEHGGFKNFRWRPGHGPKGGSQCH
jgi:hypothetical protein